MRNKEILLVVSLLTLIGGAIFGYRVFVLDFPLTPNKQVESWHVEMKATLGGPSGSLRLEAFLPRRDSFHTLVDENFVSNDFGLTTQKDTETGNRVVSWSKRNASTQEILFYRGILYETHSANSSAPRTAPVITVPQYKTAEFNALRKERVDYLGLGSLIDEIQGKSIDQRSFALELFSFIDANPADNRLVQIQEMNPNLTSLAATEVFILHHVGIYARVVNGLPLKQAKRHASFEARTEILLDNKWVQYNEQTRSLGENRDFLRWWVGNVPFYTVTGQHNATLNIAVKKHTENALTEAMWRGDPTREAMYKLSIFNLPVDVQLVFSILLLVPLGAIVVCVMRQVIGIETFGTFMPILVALSFRETKLLLGVILFCLIVSLGLIFRSYLNRLQLLIIPRLSAIMIMVVLALYLFSMIAYNTNIYTGLSISLFPLVILTMLIERISLSWEEFGAETALKAAAGSLFVAIVSYLVMNNDLLSHLMVTFPELLLIAVAMTILIGRYNGYKLMEYYRFRMMTQPTDSAPKD